MRSILFIKYYFYPSSSIGAKRIAKFCKYLPLFNFSPIILTVADKYYEDIDNSLDLKSFNIHRTKMLYSHDPYSQVRIYIKIQIFLMKFLSKVAFPDKYLIWLPFALIKARNILKDFRINYIYISCPWFSTAIIGFLLKLIYKIPLIIEYRDQWSLNVIYKNSRLAKLHRIFDKIILQNSDKIIFVSPAFLKEYDKLFPYMNIKKKSLIIPNSFDPEDYKELKIYNKNVFLITYAGNFYWPRSPNAFLDAIAELQSEKMINEKDFRFLSIGNLEEKHIRQKKVLNLIDFKGKLPHNELVHHLASSNILLLIVANGHESNIPAKLYEYLAIRKPILAICPGNSEVRKIIEDLKCGLTANINDINDIKEKITYYFKNFCNGQTYDLNLKKIENYNSIYVTKKLADYL